MRTTVFRYCNRSVNCAKGRCVIVLLHDLYWKSVLDDCEGAWSAEVEQRPEELNVVVKVRDNAHSRKLG